MKTGRGLVVFFFTMIALGSCFDPPEFPNVPEITYRDIKFFEAASTLAQDSLVLWLDFKDGDGDLGLDPDRIEHRSYPYNSSIYYQTTSSGTLTPLNTSAIILPAPNDNDGDTLTFLDIPNASAGKLVFPRTRKQPGYNFLPVYSQCDRTTASPDYEYVRNVRLHIRKDQRMVLDKFVQLTDSITLGGVMYYGIRDTLYYTLNPNHTNIDVQFLLRDPSSQNPDHPGFTEFNWQEEICQTLNARFPILSDNEGSALEGTLRYSMYSYIFVDNFANKPMKLRIRIKDRQLHVSNTVETPVFTLEEI